MKTRKIVSIILIAAMALTLMACGGSGGSSSEGGEGGGEGAKKFAGTTLYMIAEQQTPTESLKKQLGDFEEMTGIKVELEMAPFEDVVQKETLAFESKSGAYDIVAAPYQFLGNLVENEYIQPLEPFMEDESLAVIDDYDSSDIIEGMWKASGEWKDKIYGVPANSCIMFMAYRQDLFDNADEQAAFKEKYGYDLAVPTDWDQYRDIAEFFTRKKGDTLAGETLDKDMYGVSIMGKRHDAATCEYLNYAWSWGGGVFDDEGNLAINSPESVAALDYWKDLVQFAPEGVTSVTWDEQTTQIQQGVAAMAIAFNDCAPAYEDPDGSIVAGKMGYAKLPVKEEDAAHYGAWSYFIPSDSQNPEAAYVFLEWFNTPAVQKQIALDGGFPNLTSVYEDPDLNSLPYWEASKEVYAISTTRPRIPEWNAMNEVLMLQLSNALTGKATSQEALDATAKEYESLLDGQLPIAYQ